MLPSYRTSEVDEDYTRTYSYDVVFGIFDATLVVRLLNNVAMLKVCLR